jgi:hypothetical protein
MVPALVIKYCDLLIAHMKQQSWLLKHNFPRYTLPAI